MGRTQSAQETRRLRRSNSSNYLLRETEEDALDRFGDYGTLSQSEVDALWLRVLGAMYAGLFF